MKTIESVIYGILNIGLDKWDVLNQKYEDLLPHRHTNYVSPSKDLIQVFFVCYTFVCRTSQIKQLK